MRGNIDRYQVGDGVRRFQSFKMRDDIDRYQVGDRVRRLSCLVGSARGTTRSISVHAEDEIRDLQQHALFDNFAALAVSLIMVWSGRVPGTVPLGRQL